MMILINGGPALDRFGASPLLGRLLSPRCGNKVLPGQKWAGDNDAFKAWDEQRFIDMLNRHDGRPNCLFVAAPDVVGDARATLDRFWDWRWEIAGRGFPVAFVGQDGAESIDVPWEAIEAWFIGGSTEWKLSTASADLAGQAKRRGKHLHMGCVNTMKRIKIARDFHCDSIDGTGWSMFPDYYMKRHFRRVRTLTEQALMF